MARNHRTSTADEFVRLVIKTCNPERVARRLKLTDEQKEQLLSENQREIDAGCMREYGSHLAAVQARLRLLVRSKPPEEFLKQRDLSPYVLAQMGASLKQIATIIMLPAVAVRAKYPNLPAFVDSIRQSRALAILQKQHDMALAGSAAMLKWIGTNDLGQGYVPKQIATDSNASFTMELGTPGIIEGNATVVGTVVDGGMAVLSHGEGGDDEETAPL